MDSVQYTLEGVVTMSNGEKRDVDITANFLYTTDDPMVVEVQFMDGDGNPEWAFGRDLFVEALTEGQSGGGDVVMVVATDDVFGVVLTVDEESAVVQFDLDDIAEFIGMTMDMVPLGEDESGEKMVDDALRKIFEQA